MPGAIGARGSKPGTGVHDATIWFRLAPIIGASGCKGSRGLRGSKSFPIEPTITVDTSIGCIGVHKATYLPRSEPGIMGVAGVIGIVSRLVSINLSRSVPGKEVVSAFNVFTQIGTHVSTMALSLVPGGRVLRLQPGTIDHVPTMRAREDPIIMQDRGSSRLTSGSDSRIWPSAVSGRGARGSNFDKGFHMLTYFTSSLPGSWGAT